MSASDPTPEEIALSLGPLTDEQVERVAVLLSLLDAQIVAEAVEGGGGEG